MTFCWWTPRAATAKHRPRVPPEGKLAGVLFDVDGTLVDTTLLHAVCWAQGANLVDSLKDFDVARHVALYQANCLTVMASAAALLRRGLLSTEGARLAIVSSVWQERARQDKFSYAVTKAAVGGIVRAASVDLGSDGHLVNGVLPNQDIGTLALRDWQNLPRPVRAVGVNVAGEAARVRVEGQLARGTLDQRQLDHPIAERQFGRARHRLGLPGGRARSKRVRSRL